MYNDHSTIFSSDVDRAKSRIASLVTRLNDSMQVLARLSDAHEIELLSESVLMHHQGMLVREMHKLLDDCYLQLLVEVLQGDNLDCISLQKSRVQISLCDNFPLEDGDGNPEPRGHWLNLGGVITDVWHAYQFEPFDRKTAMLCKPINFTLPGVIRTELQKHVHLRNCIQHQGGTLHAKLLERYEAQTGQQQMEIRSSSGVIVIEKGKPVVFTCEELSELSNSLIRFAEELEASVYARTPKTRAKRGAGE